MTRDDLRWARDFIANRARQLPFYDRGKDILLDAIRTCLSDGAERDRALGRAVREALMPYADNAEPITSADCAAAAVRAASAFGAKPFDERVWLAIASALRAEESR